MSYLGFDSRSFERSSVRTDGAPGHFESVIGAGIRTDDLDTFDKSYSNALNNALKKVGLEPDYKYYCTHDIPVNQRDSFLNTFFEKIIPSITCAHVFYTLFSERQIKNIKVYGRMAKRLNIKLSKPTMTREELDAKHISQCFPVICAWRIANFFHIHNTQFHFDFYQGHICEAQEEIERFDYFVYPNGDCSNPLISTADLLLALLDLRLEKQKKYLLFENIRPAIPEFGDTLKVYPILNQHLPKITPVDNISIDLTSRIMHPVFWVFKNDTLITNEFLKSSKPYRNLIDYAACKNGVVKSFDRDRDVIHMKEGDYGVYFNSSGNETVESYAKLGKPLKPFKLDLMVPK